MTLLMYWFHAGEYPEEHGHPLVYASLLNHASYFFNAPTPMPKGGTGDAHSQSQQQWAKTEEVVTNLHVCAHPDSVHHTWAAVCYTSMSPIIALLVFVCNAEL